MQSVLREFLHPRNWKPPEERKFAFDAAQIAELCDEAEAIFREEPSVLRLQGQLKLADVKHCVQLLITSFPSYHIDGRKPAECLPLASQLLEERKQYGKEQFYAQLPFEINRSSFSGLQPSLRIA